MAAYTFRSVGTVASASGGGSISPGAPSGKATGDLLLLYGIARETALTSPTITGWTVLTTQNSNTGTSTIWARIADGSGDDTPSVNFGGSDDTSAWIEAYLGDVYTDIATIIAHNSGWENNAQTSLRLPALTITTDDTLVTALTFKRKTATSNDATTVTAAGGLTKRAQFIGSGTAYAAASGSEQQTTATNYDGSDFTINGTAESLTSNGVVLSLKTAAAPSFSAGPAMNSQTATVYTIGVTPSASCTIYGVAVIAGSAAPSATQIKAGQNGSGGAAKAANSKAITGVDTLTLTPSDSPVFPLYDLYFVLNNGAGDSSVASLLTEFLDNPTGESRVILTSVAADSFAEDIGAATTDIITWIIATDPDAYVSDISVSGQVSYNSFGDDSRQTGLARRFVVSSGAYANGGDQYQWVANNQAPAPEGLAFTDPILLRKSVAVTAINLLTLVTDPEGDVVVATNQTAMPPGLAITASVMDDTGAGPTTYGNTNVTHRWTDSFGDFYEELDTYQIGENTPNVVALSQAAAIAAVAAVASMTAIVGSSANHQTVPVGDVISQDPEAGLLRPFNQEISLVISLGDLETAVPNLVGLFILAAHEALATALLVEGVVSYQTVAPGLEYVVTAQNPAPSTVVDVGDPVDYTVGVLGTVVRAGSRSRGRR